jgi:magnesium transporter
MTKRRSKKLGAPPGTLVYIGERVAEPSHITLIDYSRDTFVEKKEATLAECLIRVEHPTITWINVVGVQDPKVVETLGHRFKWNPLVMEDILNTGQRPKCEDYRDYLYVVLRIFYKNHELKIDDEQFSLILGRNWVITFLETNDEILEGVRYRIRKDGSRMRQLGADYLAYAILDTVVDSTFLTLERLDEEVEKLEQELFANPAPSTLFKIQKFKREVALLRKNLWPMREAISSLERKENPLITENTRFFLRDVHDHTVLMIETIEGFRDILSGMLDIYLSNINLRMNEIMKVLTIVATIFVPLTFIASIYGMNFDNLPELHYHWGYYYVLGLMLLVAFGMLLFFHRKKWI